MTIGPFEDCVAIDTNVFEHLLNPEMNPGSHINELLAYLQELELMECHLLSMMTVAY